jgi:hypothetical protein
MTIVSPDILYHRWTKHVWFTDYGFPTPQTVERWDQVKSYNGSRTRNKVYGFRDLIRKNQNAVGLYSRDTYRVNASVNGFCRHTLVYDSVTPPSPRIRVEGRDGSWGVPNTVGHLPVTGSTADSLAKKAILDKIRSGSNTASGLVSLGELRETIRMLRSPYQSSVRLIQRYVDHCDDLSRQYHKAKTAGRKPNRRDVQQAVSGAWLETMFGLVPLVSDVAQTAEAIARFQNDHTPSRVQGRSSFRVEQNFSSTDEISGNTGIRTTIRKATEQRVQYVAGLDFSSVAFGSAGRLLDLLGVSWDQFAPTLWELLPWSFLVDYFTNVGDIIEAASTDTSSVRWISKAETLQTTHTVQQQPFKATVAGYTSVGWVTRDALFEVQRTTFSRSSPSHIGWPRFTLENPFGANLKTGNMLALLLAQTSGVSKRFT